MAFFQTSTSFWGAFSIFLEARGSILPPLGPRGVQYGPQWGPHPEKPRKSEARGIPLGFKMTTKNDKNQQKWRKKSLRRALGKSHRKRSGRWGHPGRADMRPNYACGVQTHFSGLTEKRPKSSKMKSKIAFGTTV